MADDPFATTPFGKSWLDMQGKMVEAQTAFWNQMTGKVATGEDMFAQAEKLWSEARSQTQGWMDRISGTGIGNETLRRMMDPGQFMFAGSDEVNQTIQKLVEGPEFSDIGRLEREGLKTTREWAALRAASAEYRMITGKAWMRAFQTFSKDMAEHPEKLKESPSDLMRHWLDTANAELIVTQRTKEFLGAQRKLLRAGVDYRLHARDMVEVWCETHSIPTRTEVDDLHAYVHALRREMRSLKKEVAALRAAASEPAAPRRKTAKTKG